MEAIEIAMATICQRRCQGIYSTLCKSFESCFSQIETPRSQLKWFQLFHSEQKLQFIENPKESLPPAAALVAADKLKTRLMELLRKADASEEIDEYIKVRFISSTALFDLKFNESD